jgi:hypothetical protein
VTQSVFDLPADEMRGPAGVRGRLAAFYRGWLPQHVVAARAAWGLTEEQLPVPVADPDRRKDGYFAGDPPAIDRWPMLSINSGRRTQRGVDTDETGQQQFRSIYPIRVFTWVKVEGREEAQAMRDDLATLVQVTTLAHHDFGTAGRFQLQPATMTTDFSRVEPVKGDRFVAGSYVAFDLAVVETLTDRLAMLTAVPRDTVSGVNATATPSLDVTP